MFGFDPFTIAASLAALVLALTLHEFAHAWTSHYLGDTTAAREGRLTINPIAHIDPVFTIALPLISFLATGIAIGAAKPVPFNPWAVRGGRWGAALVAAAGPLTNLFLGIFFALWLQLINANATSFKLLFTFVIINIALFVFNMIPFPPLDGSRLLYAVAPEGLRNVMDRIERAGLGAILLLFLALFYFGLGKYVSAVVLFIVNILVPGLRLP
jgi:Zn-dependent protease